MQGGEGVFELAVAAVSSDLTVYPAPAQQANQTFTLC